MAVAADLVSALDLKEVAENRYRGDSVDSPERDVVFGGQLIAQLAIAAAKAGGGKVVRSVHALFARTAVKSKPLEFEVDLLHSGRSVSSATTTVRQGDRLCARALVLLAAHDRDLIRHSVAMPRVDPPETLESVIDPFSGRDIRIAGGADIMDPDTVGPAELSVWTRLPGAPDDLAIGQGILAHASASFLIGTAMRLHRGFGQAAAHDRFSTGILGHGITFHEEFRAGEWILLVQESPYAGNGCSYGRGQAFTRDGRLIASFSEDSMIRHFPGGQSMDGKKATIL
ncbi:thioesterase family protein [Streptosporangium album]